MGRSSCSGVSAGRADVLSVVVVRRAHPGQSAGIGRAGPGTRRYRRPVLHGRDAERARLTALVDGAREARAGAVVLHGEPGSGKTALLEDAVSAAVGMRVLRVQGLESESPIAFGALHRLLRPLLGRLEALPAPQARALGVALGQRDGDRVDPFLVGLATLSVLTEAAEEAPVLVVVDDAHWLDPASADALLFTARRLDADRVALLLAVRDGAASTLAHEGVPLLHV
ncbi:MAG: ATP-binding protein, partial [Cellulomonadaceae bacterium]|nr:ATP-binding protein [Cellulomonadaceae bacterium]